MISHPEEPSSEEALEILRALYADAGKAFVRTPLGTLQEKLGFRGEAEIRGQLDRLARRGLVKPYPPERAYGLTQLGIEVLESPSVLGDQARTREALEELATVVDQLLATISKAEDPRFDQILEALEELKGKVDSGKPTGLGKVLEKVQQLFLGVLGSEAHGQLTTHFGSLVPQFEVLAKIFLPFR